MSLVPLQQLLADAERSGYAVGYFECWNLESLQGVIEAAEMEKSPVVVGFSGVNLPDPRREAGERLELYAALGRAACETARAPAALLFNESPHLDWINRAIELGFNAVMFADERMGLDELCEQVRRTVTLSVGRAAVEAEMAALLGVATGVEEVPADMNFTDPEAAARFVAETGVEALAVSIGNVHVHGRRLVELDIDRLRAIRRRVKVPLVLHGATSVADASIRRAIEAGIRKINIGSALRSAFFRALTDRIATTEEKFNPYEVIGSGLPADVLLAGRLAVRNVVCAKMQLFGSAGRYNS